MVSAESGPLVYIVEDDLDTSELIARYLARKGYRVVKCGDGNEAASGILVHEPDVVILDIMLPGKNGLDVMAELREDERGAGIPILFLSSVDDESSIVEGLRGADDYVKKPFKLLELEARLEKIIARAAAPAVEVGGTSSGRMDHLPVERDDEVVLVRVGDVIYLEASGKYSYIHTGERKYLSGFSLAELEKRPGFEERFLRVHRSYAVNRDRVLRLVKKKPRRVIVDGAGSPLEIPVGESYYQGIRASFT